MASPSEEHKETPTIKEMMHKTKLIQFFGRTIPIILQNDNGPCPLLAICNILLLRNNLSLSSDLAQVSQEKLLSLVAERLIDSNSNVENKDAGYVENQQQNIADAIDLLPRLATGIDVNIKFMRINDFEFTRECAIFDLLDIPLYHGWIVDPQDSDTSNAIGSKSYNTLMGELVALETQHMASVFMKNSEQSLSVGPTSSSDVNVTENRCIINDHVDDLITFETVAAEKEIHHSQMNTDASKKDESKDEIVETLIEASTKKDVNTDPQTADKESYNSQMNTDASEKDESKDKIGVTLIEESAKKETLSTNANEVEKTDLVEKKSNEINSDVILESSKGMTESIDESKSLTSTADVNESECLPETNSKINEGREPKDGTTAREGEVITNFLKNSASQLTIHGLFSLQDGLKERELCVFFRNNHFNTMFKFEGELYILATDQGYINQPDLVWEKLNEVNGDSVFMTHNFKEFKVENQERERHSWDEQKVMANTADYLARIDNAAGQGNTSFNSDLQLAIALQQQEFEQQQQQQQPQRVLPQSPTTAPSGLVVGPQHVQPARPRNASSHSNSRQEEPKKDKCIIM